MSSKLVSGSGLRWGSLVRLGGFLVVGGVTAGGAAAAAGAAGGSAAEEEKKICDYSLVQMSHVGELS